MGMLAAAATKETPAEARERARAVMQSKNSVVHADEAEIAAADRASRGGDQFARMEALHDLPALRLKLERHKIDAGRAKAAYDEADREWRTQQEAEYAPRLRAAVKRFDEALEHARTAHTELGALAAEARANGAGGAVWNDIFWADVFAPETPTRATRLDEWRTTLRRNRWL